MAGGKKKAARTEAVDEHGYHHALLALQIELVKLQRAIIADHEKILVLIEGRDAAGKDGTIKHITEHLSPRETRVVALGKPSDRDQSQWYFQRYVRHLPAAQEMVLFNRSWYNRAGVERVMGFCTRAQCEEFLQAVPVFEHMLQRSGIRLFKYYLDISKSEQRKRLKERHKDPLKQWKVSPIDEVAVAHWRDYSDARNEMLARTSSKESPWRIVCADDKHAARLNLIRDLLTDLPYAGKKKHLVVPDARIVFRFADQHLKDGTIAA